MGSISHSVPFGDQPQLARERAAAEQHDVDPVQESALATSASKPRPTARLP